MKKTIEIVIPVLNEQDSLERCVLELVDYLDTTELSGLYQITIADNGSSDDTPLLGQKLQNEHPDTIQYLHVGEKGVGLAFRTAIKESDKDIIGYMDLDLATDIRHIPEMYQKFEEGDSIVVGSRLLPDSVVVGRSPLREITSHGLNFILKYYLGVRFTDAMCGFKFYTRDTALALVRAASDSNGWFYCAEMLVRAEWKGLLICEIPVKWTDDSNSKVKVGSLTMSYLKEIKKLRHEKKSNPHTKELHD